MGILGKIGKGAMIAGGILGAIPSGGATLPIVAAGLGAGGGILSQIGEMGKKTAPILGGMANARLDAQQQAERNQILRDQINQNAALGKEHGALDRANLDMDRRKFQVAAPGQRLSTGVRGSMVSRAHDATVGSGGPITLSSGRTINPIHFGGIGPDDLLSPEARQLGDQVTHDMLLQQLAGDKFDAVPDTAFPGATPAPKSSGIDKLIGTGAAVSGLAGSVLPILSQILKNKKQTKFPELQFPGGAGGGSENEDGEYL